MMIEKIQGSQSKAPIISAKNLTVTFKRDGQSIFAVNGIDLEIAQGEVLTIIGESGSGKSVTLRALMGLLPSHAKVSGHVHIAGHDLYAMERAKRTALRGPVISMIFQEPATAFDPAFTIGQQIVEMILAHERVERQAAWKRAGELLEMVAMPDAKRRLHNYPHEMSGGMRQRAMIAMALACRPSILLADEPTTALDVSVQMQILLLLRELQQKLGMAVVFVTHDMGVAVEISDKMAVMYAGRFVETGTALEVMTDRRHPYTRGLLGATLHGRMRGKALNMIKGDPPTLARPIVGCAFAPRCNLASDECRATAPPMVELGPMRGVRCIYAGGESTTERANQAE